MSTSSIFPKIVRNIFKGRKKRNPAENADNGTVDDSAAMESVDYFDYSGPHGNAVEAIQYGIALALSRLDAKETQSADGESTASTRFPAMSNGISNHSEVLSSIYYFNGVVDYEERICDGFYDVWGEFPELTSSRSFPSLKPLKKLKLDDKDPREVVLFNRHRDSVYPLIEQAASNAMNQLLPQGRIACIQGLAQIVSTQMGGAVVEERALYKKWLRSSQRAKRQYNSAVFPIGKLRVGLSRHRALLYKVLADSLNIGCRLVRGLPYKESTSQAVSLVMIGETEVIVDLLTHPGRLLTLEGGSPNEVGANALFAEAPGMPSEPYWTPRPQKPKRQQQQQPLMEESTSVSQSWPQNTNTSNLPESSHPANAGHGVSGQVQVLTSAFSKVKQPFDPPSPAHNHHPPQSDFSREGSSMMSTDPYHDSGALSSQSAQGGMNRQCSSTSVLSGTSWPEETDSTRQPTTQRLIPNQQESGDRNQARTVKKTLLAENPSRSSMKSDTDLPPVPIVQNHFPSPFQGYDLPIFDDGDEEQGVDEYSANRQDSYEPTNCPQSEDISPNNKPSDVLNGGGVGAMSAFFEDYYNILTSEIELETPRIAVGSYGEVFKGTWNGTDVAVKKLLEQDVSNAMLEEFLYEVRIMKHLRHPNVLLFMGACMQPPNLAIVTEFLPRGSLYRLLHKTPFNDDRLKLRMAKDVVKGMCYLHSFKPAIVHRDLKSPNLLVDKDWTVKVCDFGMSKMKANTYLSGKGQSGTPEWMAPEVLRNERSDEKCDVYSFGVILYELVTGFPPWPNLKPMQVVGAVGYAGQQLPLPSEIDPRIEVIIRECWSNDSRQRPSFQELLSRLSQFETLPCIPKSFS